MDSEKDKAIVSQKREKFFDNKGTYVRDLTEHEVMTPGARGSPFVIDKDKDVPKLVKPKVIKKYAHAEYLGAVRSSHVPFIGMVRSRSGKAYDVDKQKAYDYKNALDLLGSAYGSSPIKMYPQQKPSLDSFFRLRENMVMFFDRLEGSSVIGVKEGKMDLTWAINGLCVGLDHIGVVGWNGYNFMFASTESNGTEIRLGNASRASGVLSERDQSTYYGRTIRVLMSNVMDFILQNRWVASLMFRCGMKDGLVNWEHCVGIAQLAFALDKRDLSVLTHQNLTGQYDLRRRKAFQMMNSAETMFWENAHCCKDKMGLDWFRLAVACALTAYFTKSGQATTALAFWKPEVPEPKNMRGELCTGAFKVLKGGAQKHYLIHSDELPSVGEMQTSKGMRKVLVFCNAMVYGKVIEVPHPNEVCKVCRDHGYMNPMSFAVLSLPAEPVNQSMAVINNFAVYAWEYKDSGVAWTCIARSVDEYQQALAGTRMFGGSGFGENACSTKLRVYRAAVNGSMKNKTHTGMDLWSVEEDEFHRNVIPQEAMRRHQILSPVYYDLKLHPVSLVRSEVPETGVYQNRRSSTGRVSTGSISSFNELNFD